MARGAPSGGVARYARSWPELESVSKDRAGCHAANVGVDALIVANPRTAPRCREQPRRRPVTAATTAGATRRREPRGRCTWPPRCRRRRPLATPSRRRPGGRTQPRPVGERKRVHEGRVPVSHGSAAMETRPEDGAPAAPESGPTPSRPIHAEERRHHPPAPPSEPRARHRGK